VVVASPHVSSTGRADAIEQPRPRWHSPSEVDAVMDVLRLLWARDQDRRRMSVATVKEFVRGKFPGSRRRHADRTLTSPWIMKPERIAISTRYHLNTIPMTCYRIVSQYEYVLFRDRDPLPSSGYRTETILNVKRVTASEYVMGECRDGITRDAVLVVYSQAWSSTSMTRESDLIDQRTNAALRASRMRVRNRLAALPDTRALDRAIVLAVQAWFRVRDIQDHEDVVDPRNGRTLDVAAAQLLKLMIEELRAMDIDLDSKISRQRFWHRLRLGPPADGERSF
jgi:hypothetical protein